LSRGLFEAKKHRRFTVADDALIREAYLNQRSLEEVAAQIGCSYGVLRQRIFHHHKDLVNTVRTPAGTKALKRYGAELMQHGATPDQAAKAIRSKIIAGKAAARVAAITAKERRSRQMLETMMSEIAAGKDRNRSIFEARMLGLSLESIGQELGVTRERIRQICDAEAFRAVTEADPEIPPKRDILFLRSA
jgi:DNA-directed RNA polymerase specialized sigma24 family protein